VFWRLFHFNHAITFCTAIFSEFTYCKKLAWWLERQIVGKIFLILKFTAREVGYGSEGKLFL